MTLIILKNTNLGPGEGGDSVLRGHGFRAPQEAVIDEHGAMVG